MRKPVLLIACTSILLSFSHCTIKTETREKEDLLEQEAEEQDGIREAQEQDFKNTVDVRLGYIPKERLIEASERAVTERRAMRLNRSMRTSALTWTERGPNTDVTGPSNGNPRGPNVATATSGRMRAVWVDLADATNKTVWIGSVAGGIWKTTDVTTYPATWSPVNDFLGNLSVSSICQNPANTNTMYFGTGEKTFNLGAIRGGGIWKSTDHGVTWNLLTNTTSFINVSRIICDALGNIYVATIGAGIKRSTDGGANWTTITPAGLISYVTEMKLSSTGRLHIVCGYYASGASGYRYTDNPATVTSATWTSPAASFTPDNINVEIATAGNTLYALPSNASYQTPVVWKSTDGGANWTATTSIPVSGGAALSSGQGWYCLAIGVDPANPNNVVVGGLNTYRTTDGGTTWTQAAAWVGTTMPYVHADQHFVTWNGSQVLIASDGGLFYSANGGVNWADRNAGLRIKQFYSCAIHPSTTNYFIAGAQDNGMHQINNPGMGGSTEYIGGDGAFAHIDQDQPQYQFGAYVFNQYNRSTNSGASWTSINYNSGSGQFINPSDYDDNNNRMYAADAAGSYVRWDNPQSGSSFTSVAVAAFGGSLVSHVSVSPYTGNRVYFGTDGGRIVRVDNADITAPSGTNITGTGMSSTPVSCVAVGTTDNNLVATFSNYGSQHVWISTTGGGAGGWTNISGNLPDIPVRWAMFYPFDNTKIILATEAGIYETTAINGASTVWTQSTSFPIVRTDMIQYRQSDGTLLAATHGRGLWSTSIPVISTYVQFATTVLDRPESTTTTTGCTGYTDYTVYLETNRAPVGTATANVSLFGGTAVQGVDYNFTTNGSFTTPSTTITLASGSTTPQPVTIRIYDNPNAETVSSRNFTLSYTLSGTTDAVAAPVSQTFTFTINDDDLPPTTTTSLNATIGAYTYNLGSNTTGQPFNAAVQSSRSQILYKSTELTAAGLVAGNLTSLGFTLQKNSIRPFSNFKIKIGNAGVSYLVDGSITVYAPTIYKTLASYTTVNGLNTFVLDAPFTWDGTSNIVVEICYDNLSAAPTDFSDVLQGYSDGGTASQGNTLWQNGINCGANFTSVGYYSLGIKPTLIISETAGIANSVETVLSATKTATLSGNYDVYYYGSTGKIMARIQNTSGFNYGCTQVTVDRAGNGATAFWNANNSTFLANKTFRVVPTTNNVSGQYKITLYYTAAEKAAWEAATGQSWNNIKMVKVKSQISNYTPATPGPDGANAVDMVTPVLGILGSDYTVTGTFTSGFSGFGVGIPGGNPLPIILVDFKGRLDNNTAVLNWSTSSELNSKSFDVEKSTDGSNFYKIGSVAAAGSSATQKNYSLRDVQLSSTNYYRLKMNDLDGRNKLSPVVLLKVNNAAQNVWIVSNPFKEYIDLRFAKEGHQAKLQLVSINGAIVSEKIIANPAGQTRWQLPTSIGAGTYVLKAVVDGKLFTHKLVKQ